MSSNYKILDQSKWSRKEHFQFFTSFDEPFFGVTVDIDVTKAYLNAKDLGVSFFLYYLHKSLYCVNQIPEFKYRINDQKEILIYDRIDASPTVDRPDNTFGFSYIKYEQDFDLFNKNALLEIERVRKAQGLEVALSGQNVVHFSAIPWINFTSLSHARNYRYNDSCPKISFGKIAAKDGKKMMPMSIHVHHGLMDGWHVGQYVTLFENKMKE